MKNKKDEEFKELEVSIKKEADIEKKAAIIEVQSRYNDLQIENLKNLNIINQKSEEITELKSSLEKISFKLEEFKSCLNKKEKNVE